MDKREIMAGLRQAYEYAVQKDNLQLSYRQKKKEIEEERKALDSMLPKDRARLSLRSIIIFVVYVYAAPYVMSALAKMLHMEDKVASFYGVNFVIALILLGKVIKDMMSAPQRYFNSDGYKEDVKALEERQKILDDGIGQELRKLSEKSNAVFPELSQKYHTTHALSKMRGYFEDNRVDTLREAIEKYEEECHRQRVEQAAGER